MRDLASQDLQKAAVDGASDEDEEEELDASQLSPQIISTNPQKGLLRPIKVIYSQDPRFETSYDPSFKPDRAKMSALVRMKRRDVGPRLSDTPEEEEKDLFEFHAAEKKIMGIFDVMNLPFFQSLVWRLRTHEHFDALQCFRTFPMTRIKHLMDAAELGIKGVSPYDAARRADLLNNIKRYGGWTQTTKLECCCSDE